MLQNETDVTTPNPRTLPRISRQSLPHDGHLATGGGLKPTGNTKQTGFSRTTSAPNYHDTSSFQPERNPGQHAWPPRIIQADILERQGIHKQVQPRPCSKSWRPNASRAVRNERFVLLRLVLRPDQASLAATAGLAAAILLPVVATLVVAGLHPVIDGDWMAYPPEGESLQWNTSKIPPTLVVKVADNGLHAAYIVGNPVVNPGAQLAMPEANSPDTPRASLTLDGLRPDQVLVHPQDLGAGRVVLATFPERTTVVGATVSPSRGSDAFEDATTSALRGQSMLLIGASVPAVAILASAFARQEIRARIRMTATLAVFGGARRAFLVIAARTGLVVTAAFLLATMIAYGLHLRGGIFDPPDDPEGLIAAALIVPTAAAWLTCLVWAGLATRAVKQLKMGGPSGEDDVAVRWPAALRPVLLGLRPLLFFFLAAVLFMVDVGFPLAAAEIPASLAGGSNEWVFGADDGLHVGRGVPVGVARVAALDSRVDAVVGETVTPTLANGIPLVIRGGEWSSLATYHGLKVNQGQAPQESQIALADRAARRLQVEIGDHIQVQGGNRPDIIRLQVSAILDAPGPLRDEAFVSEPLGRRLADLPPGQANLLRMRPQTQAALDALHQTEPNLIVASLTFDPIAPKAGTLARANITVANLGSESGQRALTLRVQGLPVGHIDVVVAGHGRQSFHAPFVVPSGPWRMEVNPTTEGTGTSSEVSWELPQQAQSSEPFEVRLFEGGQPAIGVRVGLYRGLPAASENHATATATTNGAGSVQFTAAAGDWIVGALDQYASITVLESSATTPRVDAIWTDPAIPRLNHLNTLFGRVRNPGLDTQTTLLNAYAGEIQYASQNVTLAGGASQIVSFPLFLVNPVSSVGIGNMTLRLGTQDVAAPPPGPGGPTTPEPTAPGIEEATPGQTVQARVADRTLGDGRTVLIGLATSSSLTTLAVAYLATQRTLAGRRHVAGLLQVLGFDEDRLRQRAAAEGAILGGAAALASILPAKILFAAMGRWGPAVFAHSLPDPIGWLFAIQAVAGFAGVCALAAYLGTNRSHL